MIKPKTDDMQSSKPAVIGMSGGVVLFIAFPVYLWFFVMLFFVVLFLEEFEV